MGRHKCGAVVMRASPLAQPFEDEAEIAVLEIAKAAVDEAGGLARGLAREVAGLDERDGDPAQSGVADDAGSRRAASDDQQLELFVREPFERGRARGGGRLSRPCLVTL